MEIIDILIYKQNIVKTYNKIIYELSDVVKSASARFTDVVIKSIVPTGVMNSINFQQGLEKSSS